ncbi:uncharacterized protein LOC124941150 [Impatiens glandulifera]|uniref:uncharacterized protein LOC124941150 n=1 Tax=Impatiens glandulifera TaxID=253017 RepID=UPI001FB1546F|nr:uncharacterized protein LOC124941150 [Impatiens glandulifera]
MYFAGVEGEYVCEVSSDAYTELISSLNVSYALYEYGSFLVDLVDSTYAKETFMDISNNFFPSLRHSTKLMCVGFIMVAAASMFSLRSRKKPSKIRDETNEPISSTSSPGILHWWSRKYRYIYRVGYSPAVTAIVGSIILFQGQTYSDNLKE